jgi:hypothetical protein
VDDYIGVSKLKGNAMFVLLLATDYDGEQLLGVYSSEQAAQAASEGFITHHRQGKPLYRSETFQIREAQLDDDARYHW